MEICFHCSSKYKVKVTFIISYGLSGHISNVNVFQCNIQFIYIIYSSALKCTVDLTQLSCCKQLDAKMLKAFADYRRAAESGVSFVDLFKKVVV